MPAHVKGALLGFSLSLPISDGRLSLGTWQGIYLCELRDSGGARRLTVTLERRVTRHALHVDAVAVEADALGPQQLLLAVALGERPVGADDAVPGDVGLVALAQHAPGVARRARGDVAVGGDLPLGDRAHAVEHLGDVHRRIVSVR